MKLRITALTVLTALLSCLLLSACGGDTAVGNGTSVSTTTVVTLPEGQPSQPSTSAGSYSLEDIPAYSGTPYVELSGNVPGFADGDMTTNSFEDYSPLDSLGRCGVAYACIGVDLMPTEDRGSISSVTPTGWQNAQYDCVNGKYLYNRCHLIGFQLAGENANKQNLITGTRYLNVDGMLPFENLVADYVKETENHVLYRVTPVFEGDNLVADGVQMEALSVEDSGEDVCFNVFVYNVQPGVVIDYATGASRLDDAAPAVSGDAESVSYVLNTSSKKFHDPSCSNAGSISGKNREDYTGTRDALISQGYEPCGQCKP
ncbi:MAG: DNA/RNA non-specific endonuclease [Oscillospiraceae bacterium]|nr:DNA/RNA non-specific endonuclease [Oscillospiraceae bacterium]